MLTGYRGQAAADIKALEDVRLRFSRLVEEIPDVSELDLKPIFALPPGQGCKIVDARIRLGTNNGLAYRPMIRTHWPAVTEGGT